MSRQAGDRFGPYELVALLGSGGMGEVWRAHDPRLDRDVAIKFSHLQFSERFGQEARTIAQLAHPHIAALHDVGPDYLVMELVDGRPVTGPLPWRDAARLMADVCDALAAAHGRGVVHRDLKPANVLRTAQGIKVIDFGLAQTLQQSAESTATRLTAPGIIVGTVAYMSPEQAGGSPVDGRTDLWAAGVMLYELVTGRLPFASTSATTMLAEIADPVPFALELPAEVPAELGRIVRKLVAKDPTERYQHADEAALDLRALVRDSAMRVGTVETPAGPAGRRVPLWTLAGAGVVAVAASVVALALWLRAPIPAESRVLRFHVFTQPLAAHLHPPAPVLSLSPDAEYLAYVVSAGDEPPDVEADRGQLYLRRLDALEPIPVAGAELASSPFFSPDGRWVGFESEGKLRKVAVAGGSALTICDAPALHGAVWLADDTIVFAAAEGTTGFQIARVSAAGGQPERILAADPDRERYLVHPSVSPDGSAVFLTSLNVSGQPGAVSLLELATGERRIIEGVVGDNVQYLATGDLMYVRDGSLWLVPFDLRARKVSGTPVRVLEGLAGGPSYEPGMGYVALSRSGSLAYVPGAWGSGGTALQAYWVARDGSEQVIDGLSGLQLGGVRVSPDGRRIAVRTRASTQESMQVWLYDVSRGTLGRLTPTGENWWPVWSPDGTRLAFPRVRDQMSTDVVTMATDGSGATEVVVSRPEPCQPYAWRPGALYVHCQTRGGSAWDILAAARSGHGEWTSAPLVSTSFDELQPVVSPDGRWLAYVSRESGVYEVYLRSADGRGARQQVSSAGGLEPLWLPDGRALLYRQMPDASGLAVDRREVDRLVMEVTLGEGSPPVLSAPRALFADRYAGGQLYGRDWDVTPDGRRFVMVRPIAADPPAGITVVVNWLEEVRERADR